MEENTDEVVVEQEAEELISDGGEELQLQQNAGDGEDVTFKYEDMQSFSDGEVLLSESELDEEMSKEGLGDIGWRDQVDLIHLRRFIDRLAEKVYEKDYIIQKLREEVKKCSALLEALHIEKEQVLAAIQDAETEGNTSAVCRLRAQHDRVCLQMSDEEDLLTKIKENLDTAEYELLQSQVEQGRMILAEDELCKKEEEMTKQKQEDAKIRALKEDLFTKKAAARRHKQHRMAQEVAQETREWQKQAADQAKKSHERHNIRLQQTITKLRYREVEENARQKEHVERRMETMLALKENIANNRENMRAVHARDKHLKQREREAKEKSLAEIEAQGGNATEALMKERWLQEQEKKKGLHEWKKQQSQIEITSKLLAEELRMERRRQLQPALFTTPQTEKEKILKPHPRPILKSLDRPTKSAELQRSYNVDMSRFEGQTGDESDEEMEDSSLAYHSSSQLDAAAEGRGSSLAKPEFEGMWDQHKPYQVPKDLPGGGAQVPGVSKMDRVTITILVLL